MPVNNSNGSKNVQNAFNIFDNNFEKNINSGSYASAATLDLNNLKNAISSDAFELSGTQVASLIGDVDALIGMVGTSGNAQKWQDAVTHLVQDIAQATGSVPSKVGEDAKTGGAYSASYATSYSALSTDGAAGASGNSTSGNSVSGNTASSQGPTPSAAAASFDVAAGAAGVSSALIKTVDSAVSSGDFAAFTAAAAQILASDPNSAKDGVLTDLQNMVAAFTSGTSSANTSTLNSVSSQSAGSPSVSANSPSVSANSPSVSANSPSVSANSPSVSANSPSVSANSPSVSANSPSMSANSPSVSVGTNSAMSAAAIDMGKINVADGGFSKHIGQWYKDAQTIMSTMSGAAPEAMTSMSSALATFSTAMASGDYDGEQKAAVAFRGALSSASAPVNAMIQYSEMVNAPSSSAPAPSQSANSPSVNTQSKYASDNAESAATALHDDGKGIVGKKDDADSDPLSDKTKAALTDQAYNAYKAGDKDAFESAKAALTSVMGATGDGKNSAVSSELDQLQKTESSWAKDPKDFTKDGVAGMVQNAADAMRESGDWKGDAGPAFNQFMKDFNSGLSVDVLQKEADKVGIQDSDMGKNLKAMMSQAMSFASSHSDQFNNTPKYSTNSSDYSGGSLATPPSDKNSYSFSSKDISDAANNKDFSKLADYMSNWASKVSTGQWQSGKSKGKMQDMVNALNDLQKNPGDRVAQEKAKDAFTKFSSDAIQNGKGGVSNGPALTLPYDTLMSAVKTGLVNAGMPKEEVDAADHRGQ